MRGAHAIENPGEAKLRPGFRKKQERVSCFLYRCEAKLPLELCAALNVSAPQVRYDLSIKTAQF